MSGWICMTIIKDLGRGCGGERGKRQGGKIVITGGWDDVFVCTCKWKSRVGLLGCKDN